MEKLATRPRAGSAVRRRGKAAPCAPSRSMRSGKADGISSPEREYSRDDRSALARPLTVDADAVPFPFGAKSAGASFGNPRLRCGAPAWANGTERGRGVRARPRARSQANSRDRAVKGRARPPRSRWRRGRRVRPPPVLASRAETPTRKRARDQFQQRPAAGFVEPVEPAARRAAVRACSPLGSIDLPSGSACGSRSVSRRRARSARRFRKDRRRNHRRDRTAPDRRAHRSGCGSAPAWRGGS